MLLAKYITNCYYSTRSVATYMYVASKTLARPSTTVYHSSFGKIVKTHCKNVYVQILVGISPRRAKPIYMLLLRAIRRRSWME